MPSSSVPAPTASRRVAQRDGDDDQRPVAAGRGQRPAGEHPAAGLDQRLTAAPAGRPRVRALRGGRSGRAERVERGAHHRGALGVEPAAQPRPALPVRGQRQLDPPGRPLLGPGQRRGVGRLARVGVDVRGDPPPEPTQHHRVIGRRVLQQGPLRLGPDRPAGSSSTARQITAACPAVTRPAAQAAPVAAATVRVARAVFAQAAASAGDSRSRCRRNAALLVAPPAVSTSRASASPTSRSSTPCARATSRPAATTSPANSASATDHNAASAASPSAAPPARPRRPAPTAPPAAAAAEGPATRSYRQPSHHLRQFRSVGRSGGGHLSRGSRRRPYQPHRRHGAGPHRHRPPADRPGRRARRRAVAGQRCRRTGKCLTPRWKLDRSSTGSPAGSIQLVRRSSSPKRLPAAGRGRGGRRGRSAARARRRGDRRAGGRCRSGPDRRRPPRPGWPPRTSARSTPDPRASFSAAPAAVPAVLVTAPAAVPAVLGAGDRAVRPGLAGRLGRGSRGPATAWPTLVDRADLREGGELDGTLTEPGGARSARSPAGPGRPPSAVLSGAARPWPSCRVAAPERFLAPSPGRQAAVPPR